LRGQRPLLMGLKRKPTADDHGPIVATKLTQSLCKYGQPSKICSVLSWLMLLLQFFSAWPQTS